MLQFRSLVATASVVVSASSLASASPVLIGVTPSTWTIGGLADGASNTIQFGETTTLDVCVPAASIPSAVTDGTSNTIQLTETQGLRLRWVMRVPSITDGSSNTIQLPESQCLTGIIAPQPVASPPGTIPDGTSNTIVFGENPIDLRDSAFDVCFSSIRIGSISDGSSNTIQFGETRPRQCYRDVRVGDTLDLAVPAPGASSLVTLALAVWAVRRGRRLV